MSATTTDRHEVALLRLVAHGLVGGQPADPVVAARTALATQAQDLPGALRSLALRTSGRSVAAVTDACDAGALVRSWPMRGTLHLVPAEDLAWLLRTCASRAERAARTRRAALGLDATTLDRASAVAVEALGGGSRLRRADLLAVWDAAGVSTDGQRGYHLIASLAHAGVLCLGPMARPAEGSTRGPEQLLVACDTWLPSRAETADADAPAALALRFVTGHGPSTVADLARWAGITLTQARAGVAEVRDRLTAVTVDDTEYLMDPTVRDRLDAARDEAAGVLLLPGFDEYLLGYADRSAALDPQHADRIVPGGNGMFRPTVVLDGRVVGTWRRVRGDLVLEPFAPLAPGVVRQAEEAFARLP